MLKDDQKREYKPYDWIYMNCTKSRLTYRGRKQANSFVGMGIEGEMSCKWVKALAGNGNVIWPQFHNYIHGKTDQTGDFKYYKQFTGFQQIYAVYCNFNTVGGGTP